ncbi:MAG: 23S rRNA (adenine(2503)-C(2))-methyltransferase RlmN [Gemmatimonadetes bacterium]|nr:23S rRNA (adenine(2503)-C(2))-methyltransferase RlmN [Gemmatimonadota bacterium]
MNRQTIRQNAKKQAYRQTEGGKPDLRGLTLPEISRIVAEMNEPGYRAGQIASWVYKKAAGSFEEMTNLSKSFRAGLADRACLKPLTPARRSKSRHGPTTKYLFELGDGQKVETVLIGGSRRNTLCISTQVGCAIGCRFCASGLEGLVRNLTSSEIVDQVVQVRKLAGQDGPDGEVRSINNIVVMGMGEPLANYRQVLRAVRIINADWGLGIGARRITLSTSGLVPKIYQLAEEKIQFELSVSLHAADDRTRSLIVPINRRYPLKQLMKACRHYTGVTDRIITYEYVLLKGVNDRFQDAENLVRLLKKDKCKLNLIPYNPVRGLPYETPDEHRQAVFADALRAGGLQLTMRRERGRDIDAACGQLRLAESRKARAG